MQPLSARVRTPENALFLEPLGFKRFEVTIPCPMGLAEEESWLKLAEEKQFMYLGHGPNEGDPNNVDKLASTYLPTVLAALKSAQKLRCIHFTLHFWLESRWLSREVIKRKIELLATVSNWAGELGVELNLENLSESWLDLSQALETIPDLGLTLDVGHANILQAENYAPAIIDHLFQRIRHLHLHDNNGGLSPKDDLHLMPGEGSVPFAAIFSKLKKAGYSGSATLEVKPGQMVEARQRIEQLWQDA